MGSIQDQQAPIDLAIVNALIAATPETWNSARMEAERFDEGKTERFRIVITSPEGRKEVIAPTDELTSGLIKLSDLYRMHGRLWKKVIYSVEQQPDQSWKFAAQFTY